MYDDIEIASLIVAAGRRKYFIDVRETKDGSKLLKLTEGKKMEDGSFDRHRVMIYEEDIYKVMEALQSVLKYFPKEKTRGGDEAPKGGEVAW